MSVRVKAVTLEIQPTSERVNLRQVLTGLNLCGHLTPIQVNHELLLKNNPHTQIDLSGSVLTFKNKFDRAIEVQITISEPPVNTSPHQPGRPADAERPCSEIPLPGGGECVLKETEEDKQ